MESKQKHILMLGSGIAAGFILNKIIPIGMVKMMAISIIAVYGIVYYKDFADYLEKNEGSEI